MGKKKARLELSTREWQRFCTEPGSLAALLEQDRRQVLALLEAHAAELCSDAPQDVTRLLFEQVRDRAATTADAPDAAMRLQLAALHALTTLLIKLDMAQRDARLVKVHVESLFRIMERSIPHANAAPELCHAAATCLRRMEEATPTLLLAGSKQLLELARQETSAAAEGYAMLAARVVSHGAARCLDQRQAEEGAARGEGGAARDRDDSLSLLSSIDVRALSLGVGAGASEASAPAGRGVSPVGTLDQGALGAAGATPFGSGRTGSSSMDSPKGAPGSPSGVASLVGTASTVESATRVLAAAAAEGAFLARGASIASSEISGSVQMDSSMPQLLLSPSGPGLRHYRVPQHIHWPDALAHTAVAVFITQQGLQARAAGRGERGSRPLAVALHGPQRSGDLQRACLEFLAAMPKLSVEGVACLTGALPPIMRLADLPPAQLQDALDALLHSGRTLMLQAVLKLHSEVPGAGYAEWQRRLVDAVLLMVNGPHPAEHRVIAVTWALVQHHAQMHRGRPSLFAGTWRQLMPRPDDPAQLLSLKIKALSACLAVGIGHAEEIIPMVFAWDGFWQREPSDQQLRLVTYALRMLGSAALSYAAAAPATVQAARERSGAGAAAGAPLVTSSPATPEYVQACLVSACVQLVATRPQYLPAVEAFLAHCSTSCPDLQHAMLNAIDALFSAAATGTFTSLMPPRRAGISVQKQRSRVLGGGGASAVSAPAALPAHAAGSPSSDDSSPSKHGLSAVLARMRRNVSKRLSTSLSPPNASPGTPSGSLQAAAECGLGEPIGSGALPTISETAASLAAPQPPVGIASWEEAEAWLWDSRTWTALSANLLRHDPIAYRPVLLRLAQSGMGVLPMGALRLLAAYASQYQCELPSHQLPAKEAGGAVLAICQAAAMTHLLIGPAGAGRSHGCGRGAHAGDDNDDCSVHSGKQGASPPPSEADAGTPCGGEPPQWTRQQQEIAVAMQAVLSALTSHFPVDSVRRRAQSFLDLLANPSAWDLRVRMGTMAKMLGGYFSDAVSAANYL